jgi:S1-C subfamily serine protease
VKEPGDLVDRVREADDGATLSVKYLRDRQAATTTATLASQEKARKRYTVRPI